MPNLTLMLTLQSERSKSLELHLEPLPECFILQPGQKVEIHAIFDEETNNLTFTVAPSGTFVTVYAPGEMTGFVDCLVTCNGIRLEPLVPQGS